MRLGKFDSDIECNEACVANGAAWCVYARRLVRKGNCWEFTAAAELPLACHGKTFSNPLAGYTHWPTCVGATETRL